MTEILLISLGMTLVLELAYAWLWGVKGKDFIVITVMNILTNPLVVLWHHYTADRGIWINTVLPELAAVIAEVLLLMRFGKPVQKPVSLGICINLFSYFVGFIINLLLF